MEDLPVAWEGYDRERVQAAFDVFYRHIAQLDSTLRTLEAVEVFRGQAGELRAELRSMRSAGWSPYPRGYTLTPERSMLGCVPEAVPRIALEVLFLVVVAAVVAVAEFSRSRSSRSWPGRGADHVPVELIAGARTPASTPIPAAPPAVAPPVAAVAAAPPVAPPPPTSVEVARRQRAAVAEESTEADEEIADDGSGWAAFAEPAGPEPVVLMGALAVDEEQPAQEDVATPEEEPQPAEPDQQEPEHEEPEPTEPEPEPAADVDDTETGVIARRRFLRRKQRAAVAAPSPSWRPRRRRSTSGCSLSPRRPLPKPSFRRGSADSTTRKSADLEGRRARRGACGRARRLRRAPGRDRRHERCVAEDQPAGSERHGEWRRDPVRRLPRRPGRFECRLRDARPGRARLVRLPNAA